MQCYRHMRRAVCCAHNAYNAQLALRAAFGATTKRSNANDEKDAPDEDIPTLWESGNWKPLEVNPEPEEIKGPEGELDQPPREGDPPLTKQPLFSGVRFVKRDSPPDVSAIKRGSQRSRVVSQVISEEDDNIYDSRMNVNELKHVQATAWQSDIRTLSDQLHQISDARARWINQMSPVMQAKLKEKVFNYTPCNVLPQSSNSFPREPPPWEKKSRRSRYHGFLQLEGELKAFAEWIQPTANERIARKAVVEETMNLVRDSLKDDVSITTEMELHGSEKTGLALPWSDIDIRIWDGRKAPVKAGYSAARLLHRLRLVADAMRSSDKWTLVTVRDGAYPILNAQHKESGLDVQIVAAGTNSHAQEAVVKQCLEDMPYLRAVFYAVRTFFGMRNFNDVFTGGLGSYGIFILLLATLLRNPVRPNRYRPDHGPQNPHATAFTTFFETLDPITTTRGSKPLSINLKKFAISCFPRTKFLKHAPSPELQKYVALAEKRGDNIRAGQWRMSQRNEWMPYLLTLQDPANPHNDLGRKTYAIKHILATIATCAGFLRRQNEDVRRIFSRPLLVRFAGRPDVEYKARREKLEEFGVKIAQETGQVWTGSKLEK